MALVYPVRLISATAVGQIQHVVGLFSVSVIGSRQIDFYRTNDIICAYIAVVIKDAAILFLFSRCSPGPVILRSLFVCIIGNIELAANLMSADAVARRLIFGIGNALVISSIVVGNIILIQIIMDYMNLHL